MIMLRRVAGGSMRPGLMPGRIIIAMRPLRRLQPGDVVLVWYRGKELLKRVHRVDVQRVYVLGDDPTASTDSRDFGWLAIQAVRGKVIWPRTVLPPPRRTTTPSSER